MKYHLIGDQGVSMRGLRNYLLSLGHIVSGSDLKTNGHKAINITKDIDVVVRTSAVNPGSPGWIEVETARNLGIKVLKRSELWGELLKKKYLIAVSGMHGKTTVTTMAGLLMIKAGMDPTVIVGDSVKEFDNDVIKLGESDYVVFEACEYDRSFLDFFPKVLILTNVEEEHLDTYPGGLEEIKEAFVNYLNKIPDDGLIIANKDDENIMTILSRINTKAKIIYFGLSAPIYNALDFSIGVPGKHNVLNALSVLALSDYLDIDRKVYKETLSTFSGARRRFEKKGEYNGATLIDDYGHHPTEIRATIEALAEKYPSKTKIVVFWPHQYRRIKPLLKEFGDAFWGADKVIIKPIFFVPGRDEENGVRSEDIISLINRKNKSLAVYGETDDFILDYLKKNLNKDSVLLTIGIPPVYRISDQLLREKGQL